MDVISLEEPAFYALVGKVVSRLKEHQLIKEDRWITGEEAI